jgi:hypothetical protein
MTRIKTFVDDLPVVEEKVRTRIDLIGKRFGKLVAKEKVVKKRANGKRVICYNCICDCGNEFLYPMQYLRSGQRKDCGCENPIVHLNISSGLDYDSKDYYNKYSKRYRKTPEGYLKKLYHAMRDRNRKKGFGDLPFTLKDFVNKYSKHYDFIGLFENYKSNDFNKLYAPSIDRINPNLGYFYENMQFISWKDNKEKGRSEIKLTKCVPIDMYDFKTGEFLMSFGSVRDAAFYTKLQQGNITRNLKGQRNKVGSYNFKYAIKQESDIYLKIKSLLNKE